MNITEYLRSTTNPGTRARVFDLRFSLRCSQFLNFQSYGITSNRSARRFGREKSLGDWGTLLRQLKLL